jgi:hypothetical protein
MSDDQRTTDWRKGVNGEPARVLDRDAKITTQLTEHDIEHIRIQEGLGFPPQTIRAVDCISDGERVAYLEFRAAARELVAARTAQEKAAKRYAEAVNALSKVAAPVPTE